MNIVVTYIFSSFIKVARRIYQKRDSRETAKDGRQIVLKMTGDSGEVHNSELAKSLRAIRRTSATIQTNVDTSLSNKDDDIDSSSANKPTLEEERTENIPKIDSNDEIQMGSTDKYLIEIADDEDKSSMPTDINIIEESKADVEEVSVETHTEEDERIVSVTSCINDCSVSETTPAEKARKTFNDVKAVQSSTAAVIDPEDEDKQSGSTTKTFNDGKAVQSSTEAVIDPDDEDQQSGSTTTKNARKPVDALMDTAAIFDIECANKRDKQIKKEELTLYADVKMKRFSPDEDKNLREGVKKHGPKKWAIILRDTTLNFAPGRTNDALRVRAETLGLIKKKIKKPCSKRGRRSSQA